MIVQIQALRILIKIAQIAFYDCSDTTFVLKRKTVSKSILQKWWMSNLGNAMARNMKIRPGRNPYGLVLVQSAQHLQKNVIPSL